jgi:hypothetical protein
MTVWPSSDIAQMCESQSFGPVRTALFGTYGGSAKARRCSSVSDGPGLFSHRFGLRAFRLRKHKCGADDF